MTPAAELVPRFARGDTDAVDELWVHYGPLVHGVAVRLLGEGSQAEEATVETFATAWREAAGFDGRHALDPWLAAITRRVVVEVRARHGGPVLHHLDRAFEVWRVRDELRALAEPEREVLRRHHRDGEHLGGSDYEHLLAAERHLMARAGFDPAGPEP